MKALHGKRWTAPCTLLAALVVFGGCAASEEEDGGAAETKPAAHETTAASESTETPDAPAARVTGTIKFAGTPSKRSPLQVGEECAALLDGEALLSEALVVGDQGSFTIDGLPEGSYDLAVWHEKLGEKVVPIMVEGASASVEVTFEG
jgi:hypothetical protein